MGPPMDRGGPAPQGTQPMSQMQKQEMALTGLKNLMRGQTFIEV